MYMICANFANFNFNKIKVVFNSGKMPVKKWYEEIDLYDFSLPTMFTLDTGKTVY